MDGDHYDVEYLVSNERLDAVTTGLNVTSGDRVLTICASSDQPIALLEIARRVLVVDMEQRNLDRLEQRIRLIKEGDYEGFFLPKHEYNGLAGIFSRNGYFRQEGRLDRIKANLCRLDVLGTEDIVQASQRNSGKFNKLYVSNAIGCFEYVGQEVGKALRVIAKSLPLDGLVYIAANEPMWRGQVPSDLALDEELSDSAQKIELQNSGFWEPLVYKRVS